jgi:hypothetical protein
VESIWILLKEIMAFGGDWFLLVAGIAVSLIGLVLVYKQGHPWSGLLISLSGILLVIIAALARFFS